MLNTLMFSKTFKKGSHKTNSCNEKIYESQMNANIEDYFKR